MFDYKILTFIAICEEFTLLKAANKIGLTQSAVSQHLKALEEELQLNLFTKEGRNLVLTDIGRDFYKSLLSCESIYKKFRRSSYNLINGRKSFIVGATLTIGEFILPFYLGLFKKKYPNIEISLKIENTDNCLKSLNKGEVDLALIEGPFNKDRYSHELFIRDEMVYIEKYSSGGGSTISRSDLQNKKLILREIGSGTRYYWENYCHFNKIEIPSNNIIMEVSSLTAIKAMVEMGIGSSIMSYKAIEKELKLKTLKYMTLPEGSIQREMFFVYNNNSPLDLISSIKELI